MYFAWLQLCRLALFARPHTVGPAVLSHAWEKARGMQMSATTDRPIPWSDTELVRSADRRPGVLLVGAGPAGRALADQLVARGKDVHLAHHEAPDVAAAQRHTVPVVTHPGFLPALARLIRLQRVDLVIPVDRAELSVIASGRMALGDHIDVVAPRPGALATSYDRYLTAWALRSHGIEVPNFAVPSDFSDAAAARAAIGARVVVRSRVAGGWTATALRESAEEWSRFDDDLFLQERIGGSAYKVMVYRPADGKGRVSTVLKESTGASDQVVAHRLRGGPAVTALERVGQAAVRALGVTGPAEVSLRRRADGTPVVLDLSVGFGRHTRLVPELLASVLHEHRVRSGRSTPGGAEPRPSASSAMEASQ